jgi:cytidylate kinase
MDANDKKTASAPAVSAASTATTGEPLKKRGSTKATRRAKDVEKRVTKSLDRIAEAAKKGVDKYISRRDKSDSKRKDGALLDMPENIVRSASKAAADATPLIGDMMKLVSTKETRKALRRNFRSVPTIPFM